MSWYGGPQKPLLFPLLTITTPSIPSGQTGTPYSLTLNAIQGTLPYAWSLILAPIWMSIGKATGTISGTPSVASSGTITVQVSDNFGSTAQVVYPLTIIANNPSVTTSSLPGATVGIPYSTTLAATGGTPPYTWSIVTGNAPGLGMASNGVLSGTPTTSGNDPLLIQVADHLGLTGTANLTLAVAADGPSVSTTTLPATEIGVAYSQTLSATAGYPPYTWSAAISPNTGNAYSLSASGVLTGTSTTAETEDVVATVTDIYNQPGSKSLSLVVNTNPSITTASLPNATVGSAYSFTCAATGGIAPYTWSITSDTPDTGGWLSIGSSTGTLTGTPTTAEVESVTIKVVDSLSVPSAPSNLSLTVNASSGLNFPLLGAVCIAGSVQTSMGTTAFQQLIAKTGCAVIGLYPGWSSGGFTLSSAAAAIHAINPHTKLVPYTNAMELEPGVGASGSAYSPVFNAATAMNWFLRVTWPSGAITDADGLSQSGLNQTTFTVAGTGAYAGFANYLAWRASWTAANEYATNWNGTYEDNVFYQPRVSADYNQSGSSQSASAAAQNWRNGWASYFPQVRTHLPAGSILLGNVADWGGPSRTDPTAITGLGGLLDGGAMEGVMLATGGSPETLGWATMMTYYKLVMQNTNTPNYSIFMQDGSTTNWVGLRYGICSCLLDNAYYYKNSNGSDDTVNLFDETNFSLGAQVAGPNSTATGTYSNGGLTVWKQGVWRRDFANGIILVNPRGNGAQTVTLETTYYHLRQVIDTDGVNNATAVTSVTLPDSNVAGTGGGGLILSRTAT